MTRKEMMAWLREYDHAIVAFSGGKDSLACLLYLLEFSGRTPGNIGGRGTPRAIELWHHDVDGQHPFMDWPVTPDYCRKVADHLKAPIYFSRREGGFWREMMRDQHPTAPVTWEEPSRVHPSGKRRITAGGQSKRLGTRRKFPQKTADLKTRWCSAYLKIDVCATAIRNQERFTGKRTLVVTGERAQESSARAKYKPLEPHRANSGSRHVDHWRPILGWKEEQVWDIIRRWKIRPHPAYQLGWGRVSCASCIFGSPDQWATLHRIAPDRTRILANLEQEFGTTIDRKRTVREMAEAGTPYDYDKKVAWAAMHRTYTEPVVMDPWEQPLGAYGDSSGPT